MSDEPKQANFPAFQEIINLPEPEETTETREFAFRVGATLLTYSFTIRTDGRASAERYALLTEQFGGYDAPSPITQRSGEPSAGENRTTKVGLDQSSSLEVGTRQYSPAEVCLAQVGSPEEGACQSCAAEVGTPEIGSA